MPRSKSYFLCICAVFLVRSLPRRIRKDLLPNNLRRLRKRKKVVQEEKQKRRFVIGKNKGSFVLDRI
jgi:hypothetical protein